MTDADGTHLETGWGPTTPLGDTVVRAGVLAITDAFEHHAATSAGRVERTEGFSLADAGSPSPFLNCAVALRPGASVDEVESFFAGHPGGGIFLLSLWPIEGMPAPGWELLGHPPLMVRPPGPPGPPASGTSGLRIVEALDEKAVDDFEAVVVEGFPLEELRPARPGCFVDRGTIGDGRYRYWIGYEEERPVCASAASLRPGMGVVTWVATLPEARRRGYGRALTWSAVGAAPHLPMALLASDPGRPVYESMGFSALIRLTGWARPQRP